MKRRKFRSGCIHHIYQRPIDGYVIFHTRRDFLVFLTLFFCVKKKYKVRILSVCPMVDHLHVVLEADSKKDLSAFVQDYTSRFVKEYDLSFGRTSGRLFTRRFGCAPKRNDKKARTAIAYSYNNAPERNLCNHAIDYQWNMLAYDGNDHPFSAPIDLKNSSSAMRKSMRLVDSYHRTNTPLVYNVLGRLFQDLTRQESLQLTDYILFTYCDIDFERAYRFYGDRETMLMAIDSNTGSEHDFQEEWVGYTDAVYADMGRMLLSKTGLRDMKDVLNLPIATRYGLKTFLLSQSDFIPRQVEKYLQLPEKKPARKGGNKRG